MDALNLISVESHRDSSFMSKKGNMEFHLIINKTQSIKRGMTAERAAISKISKRCE